MNGIKLRNQQLAIILASGESKLKLFLDTNLFIEFNLNT